MKNIFFIATLFLSLQTWSAPESCKNIDLTKLMHTGQVDDPTPEKIYNFPKIREQMLLAAQEGNAEGVQCYADFYNTAKGEAADFWAEKLKQSGCDISESGEITGECPTKSEAYKSTKYLINFDNALKSDTATIKELAVQIANADLNEAQPESAAAGGGDLGIDPNTEAVAACPTGSCSGARQPTDPLSDVNALIDDNKKFCCGLPNANSKSAEEDIGLARKIERTLDLMPAAVNQKSYNSCVSKMPTNKEKSNAVVGTAKCAYNAIQAFVKGLWEGLKGLVTGAMELWAHRAQIYQIVTDKKAFNQFVNTLMSAISQYIGERMDVMDCYKPSEKTQYVCKMVGNIAGTFASPNMAASLLGVIAKSAAKGIKMSSKVLVGLLSKSERGTKILNATRKVTKPVKAAFRKGVIKAPRQTARLIKGNFSFKTRTSKGFKVVTGTIKGGVFILKSPIYIAKGVAFTFKLPFKGLKIGAEKLLSPLTKVTGSASFQNMFYQAGRATKKAATYAAGSNYGLGAQMGWKSAKSAATSVAAPVANATRTTVSAAGNAVRSVTTPVANVAKAAATATTNGAKKVVGTVIKPKQAPVTAPTELGVVYTKNLTVAETANFNNSVGNALSKPYRKPKSTIFVDEPSLVVKPAGGSGQSLTLVSGNGSRTLTEVGKIGPKVKPKLIEQPDGSLVVRVGRKTYKLPERTTLPLTEVAPKPSLAGKVAEKISPYLTKQNAGKAAKAVGKSMLPSKGGAAIGIINGSKYGLPKAEPNARPEDSVGPDDDAAIMDSILAPAPPPQDGGVPTPDDVVPPPEDMILPEAPSAPVTVPQDSNQGSSPSPMMDAAEAAGM